MEDFDCHDTNSCPREHRDADFDSACVALADIIVEAIEATLRDSGGTATTPDGPSTGDLIPNLDRDKTEG